MSFYRYTFVYPEEESDRFVIDVKIDDATGEIKNRGDLFGKYMADGDVYPIVVRRDGTIDFGNASTEERFWSTNLWERKLELGGQIGIESDAGSWGYKVQNRVEL